MIEIELPLPPSVNAVWRQYNGRTIISKEYREYKRTIAMLVVSEGHPRITGRLKMEIDLYFPDKRKRDLANFEKALSDSLVHAGVFEDDSQIEELIIRRGDIVKGGKCVVRISQVGPVEGIEPHLDAVSLSASRMT